ncbi:uncharacterized protein LOC144696753 [Cetorhinus maximus]
MFEKGRPWAGACWLPGIMTTQRLVQKWRGQCQGGCPHRSCCNDMAANEDVDARREGRSGGHSAPRLSDECLAALLEEVAARRDALVSKVGKRRPMRLTERVWKEVAARVSSHDVERCAWVQCRKWFNDLLPSGREKTSCDNIERSRNGRGPPQTSSSSPGTSRRSWSSRGAMYLSQLTVEGLGCQVKMSAVHRDLPPSSQCQDL